MVTLKPSTFGKFLENSGTIFRLHISLDLSNGGSQVWSRFDAINSRFWSFPVTHKTDMFDLSRTIPDSNVLPKITVFWWFLSSIINPETFVAMWSSYFESTCFVEQEMISDFDFLWSHFLGWESNLNQRIYRSFARTTPQLIKARVLFTFLGSSASYSYRSRLETLLDS